MSRYQIIDTETQVIAASAPDLETARMILNEFETGIHEQDRELAAYFHRVWAQAQEEANDPESVQRDLEKRVS